MYPQLSSSDYLGTDKVYAGVLNAISLVLERKFGQLSIKLFRAFNHNGRRDLVPYLATKRYGGVLKKSVWKCYPFSWYLWYFTILTLLSATVASWAIFGVPDFSASNEEGESFVLIALSSFVSIGFLSKLPAMFYAVSNTIHPVLELTPFSNYKKYT